MLNILAEVKCLFMNLPARICKFSLCSISTQTGYIALALQFVQWQIALMHDNVKKFLSNFKVGLGGDHSSCPLLGGHANVRPM